MNNSRAHIVEDFDEQELQSDRRMTRVITKDELQLSDQSGDSDSEYYNSYTEEVVQGLPTQKNENPDNIIDRVKGMTPDDVRELLHKLNISEDEENPKGKIDEEEESDIEEKQQKNKQTAQAKTVSKEGKKNKEGIEAKTKENKKNKEGIENSSENTINKTKKVVKGKKNNSKSTNIDARSEGDLNNFEKENEREFVEAGQSNNTQDENLIVKTNPNDIGDHQEKNPAKNKNKKIESHITNKEKQTKSSKKVGSENSVKESESHALVHVESHTEGRVMRSTRSRQEHAKSVLNEINEPLKDMVSEIVKVQNKKNVKKLESEIKKLEQKPDSTVTEEGAVEKKKRTGKKVATEIKKHEETEVNNETKGEEKPVKNRKTGKKATTEMLKEAQASSSSVKEDANVQTQKNHKKDNTKAMQDTVQKEVDSIGKSTKSKEKTTNSKASKVVEEPQSGTTTSEKTKLKSKTDPVKNKKLLENKENKVNEDTAPNKRATRKK